MGKYQKKLTKRIIKRAKSKRIAKSPETVSVPSGSTMINIACSETISSAFMDGGITNIIGDSFTGKTLLALAGLTECANTKSFDEHDLIHDNAQRLDTFDIDAMFGEKADKRIGAPFYDKDGTPIYSKTIQGFKRNIFKKLKEGKPFIWVLDSLDALTSKEELVRAEKEMSETDESKEKGSYKTEKPRLMSELLRIIKDGMKPTNSHLIVISQTRANLNASTFGPKKKRSGGDALQFYCTTVMWLAVKESIKKKKRVIGNVVKVKITKNKHNGKRRNVLMTLYDGYGIDDITSCAEFMIEEGNWSRTKSLINTKGFLFEKVDMEELIEHMEKNPITLKRLKHLVLSVWMEIEKEITPDRKKKYG